MAATSTSSTIQQKLQKREPISIEEALAEFDSQSNRLIKMIRSGYIPETSAFTLLDKFSVYTLLLRFCTNTGGTGYSNTFYNKFIETIQTICTKALLTDIGKTQGFDLLVKVANSWQNFLVGKSWTCRMFQYLNRYHIPNERLPTLEQTCDDTYYKLVFQDICPQVARAFTEAIKAEREGAQMDRSVLRQIKNIYVAMHDRKVALELYRTALEAVVVEDTVQFFHSKALEWLENDSVPVYLEKTESALVREAERIEAYMDPTSESIVLEAIERELLQNHQTSILEKSSGLLDMLENVRRSDLSRLYRVYSRISDGLNPIAKQVREFIQASGIAIVNQREEAAQAGNKESLSDPTFVKSLLALQVHWQDMVKNVFGGNSSFQKAMKDAFEVFINTTVTCKYSNIEMIATYCDRILRSGGERLTESQMEEEIEKVVQLFSFIIEKDTFGDVYRNQLAKRLLNEKSASWAAEKSMISRLKHECGPQFTSKMEGMMTDLQHGHEKLDKFNAWRRNENSMEVHEIPTDLQFKPQVLTQGWWPSFRAVQVRLPKLFASCQAAFESYYNANSQNRRLAWQNAEGTVIVKAKFKKSYDLTLTTLQACVLIFFNDQGNDSLPLRTICEALQLDEDVGKRVLHSLSCCKFKVLRKTPSGRSIGKSDTFGVETEFAANLRKLRIPMASLDEVGNPKRVEADRRNAIDAAIVRIMKTRQRMKHQDLVAEVLNQLHFFRPDAKVVKSRIDNCLEAEYMERDEEDFHTYEYVA